MNNGAERPRNWKGQSSQAVDSIQHRWQTDMTGSQGEGIRSRVKALRRFNLSLLVIALGMLTFFVYLLLYAPVKTPVIAVAATNYSWPMPPNAWAKEDLLGLETLNGKTLICRDASLAWQTKSAPLEDLKSKLREVENVAKLAGSLVIYLSMHGAVNEDGQACLIPPGASALDTSDWITLDALESEVSRVLHHSVQVLLVLDCVHQRVNWQAGMVHNTFAERVEAWMEEKRPPNLTLLSSASSGEQAWAGPELRSSIFGREFRLGLAGAADSSSSRQPGANGNEDGAVSLRELADYLSNRVDGWVSQHRADNQTPQVLPKTYSDFRVAWSLKRREVTRLLAQKNDLAPASPSIDEMAELWRMFDKLRQAEAFREDPKTWARLEQELLWLDQISVAGQAYSDRASKQTKELQHRLAECLLRAAGLAESNSYIARASLLRGGVNPEFSNTHLPSLALKEFMGEVSLSSGQMLRRRLQTLTDPNSDDSLARIAAAAGLTEESQNWNELNFVAIATKYERFAAWPDTSVARDLLELRDRNERQAVQGDVRGHRLRRNALNTADQFRRQAEDQLFIGSTDGEQGQWTAWRNALDAIDATPAGLSPRVDRAWGMRDRGLAELAYLAAWVSSPDNDLTEAAAALVDQAEKVLMESQDLTVVAELESKDAPGSNNLSRLIEGLRELGTLLVQVPIDGASDLARIDNAYENVKREREALDSLVQRRIEQCLHPSSTSTSKARSIAALLELPFLKVDDRVKLRRKLDTLRDFMGHESTTNGSALPSLKSPLIASMERSNSDSKPAKNRLANWLKNWGTHPLAAILQLSKELPAAKSGSDLDAVDAANALLRDRYASFNRAGTVTPNPALPVLTDEWLKAGVAEQVERATLPLCSVKDEECASVSFRNLALKDMLIWYAKRTTEDFYADANDEPGQVEHEAFFERAARQVLEFAKSLPQTTSELTSAVNQVGEKLTVLGPISKTGVKLSVKAGPPTIGSNRMQFDVSVQPSVSQMSAGSAGNPSLPAGIAVALVRDNRGILSDVRCPIPVPVSPTVSSYSLSCPKLDQSVPHEALVVYRGHAFRAPMFVGQGILVDFKPTRFDSADLVLRGDRQRQPSIMFILDCSWSMGEQIPVEAIDARSQSRLELAKDHILRLITQIAARPDARLGLRLFGHRIGWSRPVDPKTGATTGSPEMLPQLNYPSVIPDDLVPSRDTEAIVPLGRFTPEMIGGVSRTLAKMIPWGQSPLYLAMIEAFKDFGADDNSTTKSIVVITDGDNFQFNLSGRPGGDGGNPTSIDDVMRAWESAKIPLFILGVGISDSETPNARKTLQSLAQRTQGKYYDIENGSDLLRALLEQLATADYQVKLDSSADLQLPSPPVESKLNSQVEIKNIALATSRYQVLFQSISKPIQLAGGESLEMFVREDGQDIFAKPYEPLSPKATLIRPNSNELIARVHRPLLERNGVVFPISLQDPGSHFTPRPDQVWIEVVPVLASGKTMPRTYVFYDTHYEPGKPVPLLAWHASDWPANATQADVRVWAKNEASVELQSIPLNQLTQDAAGFAKGIPVNGVEGITLRGQLAENLGASNAMQIQITELHGERSRGVGSIRIVLDAGGNSLPTRITRRFDSESRMAIHTFEFESAMGRTLLASSRARLVITSREATLEGAWQSQGGQPIRVGVTNPPEVLPLEAAIGLR